MTSPHPDNQRLNSDFIKRLRPTLELGPCTVGEQMLSAAGISTIGLLREGIGLFGVGGHGKMRDHLLSAHVPLGVVIAVMSLGPEALHYRTRSNTDSQRTDLPHFPCLYVS
jgi:hypothetical protein